jgi:hypothetical protein
MTRAMYERLLRMPEDQCHRVMERACIIRDGNPGMDWSEADERALAEEGIATQKTLVE